MSISRYYILVVLYLILPIVSSAQVPDSYLKVAAENNPGLKAKYAEFEASLQKAAQVGALPDPTLSFGYFIAPVETRVGPQRAKLSLSQMFPWFGTLAAKRDVATLEAESKYQIFLNARNELYFKVKSAWYPLYEVERKLLLEMENKEILSSYKRLSNTAFKNNRGAMTDVIRTDIMLEDAITEIELLKEKRQPLLIHFNKLLNRPELEEVTVSDSLFLNEVPINYRKDSLLLVNPMLTSIDSRIEAAIVQEKLAHKQGLPKFGIGLDYVLVDKRTDVIMPGNGNDILMPMVSMSLPIFRGKYKAAVREAQSMQKALKFSKEDFENNLVVSYESTFYELNRANELYEHYDGQIVHTKQVIRLLLIAYSNSGRDFEEILRMQQQLLKYETAKVGVVKDFYTALAKLDYLTAKSE